MTERLEYLWKQVEEIRRTKGHHHPDFDRALELFRSEQRRLASGRRAESLGPAANGFRPRHPGRDHFGAGDREPDPDRI